GRGPQRLLEVLRRVRQGVEDELDRRGQPDAERATDLRTDETLRALERRGGRRALLVGPQHGVEHRGVLEVTRDPDLGDRHEAEPRVLDPPLELLRDDHPDPVSDLAAADLVLAHAWLRSGSGLLAKLERLDDVASLEVVEG